MLSLCANSAVFSDLNNFSNAERIQRITIICQRDDTGGHTKLNSYFLSPPLNKWQREMSVGRFCKWKANICESLSSLHDFAFDIDKLLPVEEKPICVVEESVPQLFGFMKQDFHICDAFMPIYVSQEEIVDYNSTNEKFTVPFILTSKCTRQVNYSSKLGPIVENIFDALNIPENQSISKHNQDKREDFTMVCFALNEVFCCYTVTTFSKRLNAAHIDLSVDLLTEDAKLSTMDFSQSDMVGLLTKAGPQNKCRREDRRRYIPSFVGCTTTTTSKRTSVFSKLTAFLVAEDSSDGAQSSTPTDGRDNDINSWLSNLNLHTMNTFSKPHDLAVYTSVESADEMRYELFFNNDSRTVCMDCPVVLHATTIVTRDDAQLIDDELLLDVLFHSSPSATPSTTRGKGKYSTTREDMSARSRWASMMNRLLYSVETGHYYSSSSDLIKQTSSMMPLANSTTRDVTKCTGQVIISRLAAHQKTVLHSIANGPYHTGYRTIKYTATPCIDLSTNKANNRQLFNSESLLPLEVQCGEAGISTGLEKWVELAVAMASEEDTDNFCTLSTAENKVVHEAERQMMGNQVVVETSTAEVVSQVHIRDTAAQVQLIRLGKNALQQCPEAARDNAVSKRQRRETPPNAADDSKSITKSKDRLQEIVPEAAAFHERVNGTPETMTPTVINYPQQPKQPRVENQSAPRLAPVARRVGGDPSDNCPVLVPAAVVVESVEDMVEAYLRLHGAAGTVMPGARQLRSSWMQVDSQHPVHNEVIPRQVSTHDTSSNNHTFEPVTEVDVSVGVVTQQTEHVVAMSMLISEACLEEYPLLARELHSDTGEEPRLLCIDCQLQSPISMILDATSCVVIVDVAPLLASTTSQCEFKLLVKGLTQIAFKFHTMWLLILRSPEQHTTSLILRLSQALSKFPMQTVIRECITDHNNSNLAKMIRSIVRQRMCNETHATAASKSLNDRPYLDMLNTSTIGYNSDTTQEQRAALLQHCEYLQLFPTINFHLAALLLSNWSLKEIVGNLTAYLREKQSVSTFVGAVIEILFNQNRNAAVSHDKESLLVMLERFFTLLAVHSGLVQARM